MIVQITKTSPVPPSRLVHFAGVTDEVGGVTEELCFASWSDQIGNL